MTERTKRAPSPWIVEQLTPGVGQVRAIDPGREDGTRKAEQIHDTICTACFQMIGTEPFIEVNGAPKHARHMRGE